MPTICLSALVPFLCLALLAPGCSREPKETHADILKRNVEKFDEMTALLKTVTDVPSANAAAPKIRAIGEDIRALKNRGKALPVTAEDERKIEPEKQALIASGKRMTDEINRIGAAKLLTPEFMAALKSFNGAK